MQPPPDTLFHRHLVLAYAFTWVLQLSYLTYVVGKRFKQRS